ncbi:MAG: oligosaccharide flippase family protein [Saprospiraceae bacterium]|nr:oligosaccharide flippase family protein [Saprospiraceae bacterium]
MNSTTRSINSTFRWQFASSVFITIVQVVGLVLLGRYLDFKELGAYALFQIAFRFALYVFEPGMYFSIVQKHSSNSKLLGLLTKKQIWYLWIPVILVFAGSIWSEDVRSWRIIIAAILVIWCIGLGSLFHNLLILYNKQKEIAKFQSIAYFLEFIWILSLIRWIDPLTVFVFGVVLRYILFYGFCFWEEKKVQRIQLEISDEEIKHQHIQPGKSNMLSQALSFVQGQYDTVLITVLFGLNVLGPYNLATEYSYLAFSKINPLFHKAFFPHLSKAHKNKEDTATLIQKSITQFLFVMLPIYMLLWVNRNTLLNLAYGQKSEELAWMAGMILMIAFIKSVNNQFTTFLLALGKAGFILKLNLWIFISNYIICILFYFLKIELGVFLIFSILYSSLYLGIGIYYLQSILKCPQLLVNSSTLQVVLSAFIGFLITFGLVMWQGNNLFSLSFSVITFALLLYILNKDRVTDLLQLRILS